MELLSVTSGTVNISKKGASSSGVRSVVKAFEPNFIVPPAGQGAVHQTMLKLAVFLKEPSELGGGKAPAIPTAKDGGGSAAGGMTRGMLYNSFKQTWIGEAVLEFEKTDHGNSHAILKRLVLAGDNKNARRQVLVRLLESIAVKVTTAELAEVAVHLQKPDRATVHGPYRGFALS